MQQAVTGRDGSGGNAVLPPGIFRRVHAPLEGASVGFPHFGCQVPFDSIGYGNDPEGVMLAMDQSFSFSGASPRDVLIPVLEPDGPYAPFSASGIPNPVFVAFSGFCIISAPDTIPAVCAAAVISWRERVFPVEHGHPGVLHELAESIIIELPGILVISEHIAMLGDEFPVFRVLPPAHAEPESEIEVIRVQFTDCLVDESVVAVRVESTQVLQIFLPGFEGRFLVEVFEGFRVAVPSLVEFREIPRIDLFVGFVHERALRGHGGRFCENIADFLCLDDFGILIAE